MSPSFRRAGPPPVSRPELRRLLESALINDANLEAFCLDHFPAVKRQFADGMNRTARLNLLLENTPPGELVAALRSDYLHVLEDVQEVVNKPFSDPGSAWFGVDPARAALSEQLTALYGERETLLVLGHATTELDLTILELRRQLRQGPQLQAGEFLGDDRYRLLARIGRGGFATVWMAIDRRQESQQRVAIKVLHSDLAADPQHLQRFHRGALRMAELAHRHVVRVIEPMREEHGFHFFVMEHLQGGDLHQSICAGGLSTEHALRVILQAGEALQYAHERGLVHRDIKPGNILLDVAGEARLTDFDLVLANDTTGGTRTGALGTFLYAAPEEMEDARRADVRSDVYSLGMTLAFILYGRRLPQQALTDQSGFLGKLPCSRALRSVIRQAIAMNPAQRFATVAELCRAIQASSMTVPARREASTSGAAGWSARGKLGNSRWLVVVSLIATAALSVKLLLPASSPPAGTAGAWLPPLAATTATADMTAALWPTSRASVLPDADATSSAPPAHQTAPSVATTEPAAPHKGSRARRQRPATTPPATETPATENPPPVSPDITQGRHEPAAAPPLRTPQPKRKISEEDLAVH